MRRGACPVGPRTRTQPCCAAALPLLGSRQGRCLISPTLLPVYGTYAVSLRPPTVTSPDAADGSLDSRRPPTTPSPPSSSFSTWVSRTVGYACTHDRCFCLWPRRQGYKACSRAHPCAPSPLRYEALLAPGPPSPLHASLLLHGFFLSRAGIFLYFAYIVYKHTRDTMRRAYDRARQGYKEMRKRAKVMRTQLTSGERLHCVVSITVSKHS